MCRSDYPLEAGSKKKMAAFCNVHADCIIENLTCDRILEIPLMLEKEGFASAVLRKLKLEDRPADLTEWKSVLALAYDTRKTRTANSPSWANTWRCMTRTFRFTSRSNTRRRP